MPFYGVWVGKTPGIYETWDDCQNQVKGFSGAKFKKLNAKNKIDALKEFEEEKTKNTTNNEAVKVVEKEIQFKGKPTTEVLTVDGASNGENCEFQAVWYPSGKKAFSSKVFDGGTNNIAEFLGLISAVKYLKDRDLPLVVYTDSVTAMAWFKNKKPNTTAGSTGKLTKELEVLLSKSIDFLNENSLLLNDCKIMKWETKDWGEIPADFGRK